MGEYGEYINDIIKSRFRGCCIDAEIQRRIDEIDTAEITDKDRLELKMELFVAGRLHEENHKENKLKFKRHLADVDACLARLKSLDRTLIGNDLQVDEARELAETISMRTNNVSAEPYMGSMPGGATFYNFISGRTRPESSTPKRNDNVLVEPSSMTSVSSVLSVSDFEVEDSMQQSSSNVLVGPSLMTSDSSVSLFSDVDVEETLVELSTPSRHKRISISSISPTPDKKPRKL